jgi:predicted  nucleic acid-binding Zn-ribbon protein
MGIVINKCVKCGREWPQSTPAPPRRCPAAGCRTVKWSASMELSKRSIRHILKEGKRK